MTYVITGATSFIGLELIDLLLKKGHSVYAVCRPDSSGIAKISVGATIVLSEMMDYGNLHRDILSADVFINLAWGGTGHSGRDVVDIQKENEVCTMAAMFAADRMNCKLFVESGSQAEYGSTTQPQTEDMECRPFSEYGKAKLSTKQELWGLSEELQIKYIHLRIFSIFGEKDHPWTLVMSALDKMLRNEPVDLSPCTQNWNFLYVKDAVKQIVGLCDYALQKKDFCHEIYNIASDDTRQLKEFVEEMKVLSASTSQLNFGAIIPQNLVSLQPNMSKTQEAIEHLNDHSFADVIKLIIKKKQENSL